MRPELGCCFHVQHKYIYIKDYFDPIKVTESTAETFPCDNDMAIRYYLPRIVIEPPQSYPQQCTAIYGTLVQLGGEVEELQIIQGAKVKGRRGQKSQNHIRVMVRLKLASKYGPCMEGLNAIEEVIDIRKVSNTRFAELKNGLNV